LDSFAHGFCENLCKDHSRSFAVTRDFARGKKNYLEQAGPSFPLHSLVAPSIAAAHLFGEVFSLILTKSSPWVCDGGGVHEVSYFLSHLPQPGHCTVAALH
jgi:hypothetical protein